MGGSTGSTDPAGLGYTLPVDDTAPRTSAVEDPRARIKDAARAIGTVVQGKHEVVTLAVTACVAGGHVLIEDIPGVGKSTLARALAQVMGGSFHRIQFTSDLLPADVIGTNMWITSRERFEFREGPVFANVVLADEVNRAPPRTQSALLEAMSERQVSMDGVSRRLPQPFTVIATQNPLEHHGTYPLPEAQKDRFLIRTRMGYTDEATETALIAGREPPNAERLAAVASPDTLALAQEQARAVFVHEDVAGYARQFVASTRAHPSVAVGVSTRGAIAWMSLARADAYLRGETQVTPGRLQDLAVPALAHRLSLTEPGANADPTLSEELIRDLLSTVPVPT